MSKYIAKKPDTQGYIHFSAEENETWQILIERQLKVIENRACDEFIEGLKILNLPRHRVPQCSEISEALQKATQWSVTPVDTIIPLETFFFLIGESSISGCLFYSY